MLQARLENEQFNSLPVLYTTSRSRNDFITTDRPDSAQLVDLHVYIIPTSVWRNLQHLAQNQAMNDAISAGFVRVSPDSKLNKLRESIELACGGETFFPREFIFLRSVGRNLTRVKPNQESELKVKHYRPPQTLASEIYLLEGRPEDYASIPSVSPALSSASYVFGRRYRYRLVSGDYTQESSRLPSFYQQLPSQTEKDPRQLRRKNPSILHFPTSGGKNRSRATHMGSDLDDSSTNASVTISVANSRELNKLKEEQERLRQRQAELERMRRAAEGKKAHSDREENERQRREKQQADDEEEERRQRKLEEDEDRRRRKLEEEEERRRQKLEKEENERRKKEKENEEKHRRRGRRRDEKADGERRHTEQLESAATKIQASFRGFKDRQAFRDRQRNLLKKSPMSMKSKRKSDINDDELSDGSDISSRTSVESSSSDLDSHPSRPETRIIKKSTRESMQSNSSSLLSASTNSERKIRSHPSSSSYTITNHEIIRAATVTKMRAPNDKLLPSSTPDVDDEEDKTYEIKRRHDQVEEKRKAKELEEQRRKELAKLKEPIEIEALRLRLQELRKSRADLEKVRDEVIKNLKHVHQRLTLRRKEARDMWKKKYFKEKKKTPPIEDKVTQLKTDLDLIHSKVIQTIDNECKHSAQAGCIKEAETGNSILQITRIQYEMASTRQQLDQAKLRLTTDLKLKNQAENECKTLKHELGQAKMNLNHIKNRLLS